MHQNPASLAAKGEEARSIVLMCSAYKKNRALEKNRNMGRRRFFVLSASPPGSRQQEFFLYFLEVPFFFTSASICFSSLCCR